MQIEDIMMKVQLIFLKKLNFFLKDQGMTINGVKKILNGEDL